MAGRHCPLLEQLDISHSYVTDTGLLALCGVTVTNKDKEVYATSGVLKFFAVSFIL